MQELLSTLKDNVAIVVALIAAAVSIVNLIWSARLNERRERRKAYGKESLIVFLSLKT